MGTSPAIALRSRRIFATIITLLVVLAVWKFIDVRVQPPPPPDLPPAAQAMTR